TIDIASLRRRPTAPTLMPTARGAPCLPTNASVWGKYTLTRQYSRGFEGNLPTIGRRIQQREDRAATVAYTHVFRPTLLNELRWGFALNNNPVIGPLNGLEVVKDLGLVGLAPNLPDISGLLKVN